MPLSRVIPLFILLTTLTLVLLRPRLSQQPSPPSVPAPISQLRFSEEKTSTSSLPRPGFNLSSTKSAFADAYPDLFHAVNQGQRVALTIGAEAPETFIFRPRQIVSEDYRLRLGLAEDDWKPALHAFEGLSLTAPRHQNSTVTLVMAGPSLAAVIRRNDGRVTYVRSHPETGVLQAKEERPQQWDAVCSADALDPHLYTYRSDTPLPDGEAFWRDALETTLVPEQAALTGVDPATNELDKYINPIPRATRYDASLKEALMLMVLDKEATGSATTQNLTSKASLFLATISNVAAAYENQLGIRLLVQEMIMIPDSDAYEDVPNGGIEDFRDWMVAHRLHRTYRWSMATKFGAGLEGQTLGVAFVRAVGNTSAVSVCRATARWDVLAHEMGHNLGSEHSTGGLMNASSSGGSNRNFFTDVTPGETSAKDIYDYVESGTSRLYGDSRLRHPEEIPFANSDFESTPINTPVTLSPLSNDDVQVRNGRPNHLSLEELGALTPLDAGSVRQLGDTVLFEPAEDFQGTAWFSYSLRGSEGNGGRGWLHKGDIAVQVGTLPEPLQIDLAPGASYSFVPNGGTSGLTQPDQALVSRSRDDSRLLLIRVDAEASGTDSFRAGGRTYALRYHGVSPKVTNDRYVYDVDAGSLTFNPLLNDEGAGEPWVNPIRPTIGVGTDGHDSDGDELFPTTYRLVSISNLTPEKGRLSTRTLPFINNGVRDNRLDSLVTFTATSGASGSARLTYIAEDATGQQAEGKVEIILPFRIDTLVATGDVAHFEVATDAEDDLTWMLPEFNDDHWRRGATGLGYDTGPDYLPEIATSVEQLRNVSNSLRIRLPFNAENVAQFTHLSLRMKIDDAFVAYLNGHEIARSERLPSIPSPLPWNVETTSTTSDSQALTFTSYEISSHLRHLREGRNVLAIHGINGSLSSSDFLVVPELEASVTGSGFEWIEPRSSTIRVAPETWFVIEAQPFGAVAGSPVAWSVTSGNSQAVTFQELGEGRHGVRATTPGLYVLQGRATENDVEESLELQVEVAADNVAPAELQGASIGLEETIQSSEWITPLEATVAPPEASNLHWEQVSGPSSAIFSHRHSPTPSVATPDQGIYRFRLFATHEGVTSFREVWVEVTLRHDHPQALIREANGITATTATLRGLVLPREAAVQATFFWDTQDRGPQATGWAHQRSTSGGDNGNLRVTASDLLFETLYFYRLRIRHADAVTWSEAMNFTTQMAPLLTETLIDAESPARVTVPLDATEDPQWRETDFEDGLWRLGSSRVGYDLDPEYAPWIDTDIENEMYTVATSVYIRIPFELREVSAIESLLLRLRYDDAFIAYLNGEEIARSATAPQAGDPSWDSAASIRREDREAVTLENYELSQYRSLLRPGRNVLALQGMNNIPENRDLLLAPELLIERRSTYYDNWLAQFPLTEDVSAFEQDPDSDGFSNLLEYALGGDPSTFTRHAAYALRLESSPEGGILLSYDRRAGALQRGLRFTLESSDQLHQWEAVPSPLEHIALPWLGTETVQWSVPPEQNAATYWRVRVSIE